MELEWARERRENCQELSSDGAPRLLRAPTWVHLSIRQLAHLLTCSLVTGRGPMPPGASRVSFPTLSLSLSLIVIVSLSKSLLVSHCLALSLVPRVEPPGGDRERPTSTCSFGLIMTCVSCWQFIAGLECWMLVGFIRVCFVCVSSKRIVWLR